MPHARNPNWIGIFTYLCGLGVVVPSLLALALNLATLVRQHL
jgi:hypothetical protein